MINDILFRNNYDGFLLRCFEKDDAQKMLTDLHDGPIGGHYRDETTTHKVLQARYYWPTFFKDAYDMHEIPRFSKLQLEEKRDRTFHFNLLLLINLFNNGDFI